MVGTRQRVLVEGPSRKDAGELAGAHREQPCRELRRHRRDWPATSSKSRSPPPTRTACAAGRHGARSRQSVTIVTKPQGSVLASPFVTNASIQETS